MSMSQETQIKFARLVDSYYQQHENTLKLSTPRIIHDGFVSKSTMSGSGGTVEILYGPAEYHAEIFVTTLKGKKCWNLADLMSVGTVRDWLVRYSQNADSQSKVGLEADIEWIFLILTDGLRGVADFEWLYKVNSTSQPKHA